MRTEKNRGIVRIFVCDTKKDTAHKIRKEAECAQAMAAETASAAWREDARGFKTLALEHKLAAKRGDFFEAYNAMELLDKDGATPKPNGRSACWARRCTIYTASGGRLDGGGTACSRAWSRSRWARAWAKAWWSTTNPAPVA